MESFRSTFELTDRSIDGSFDIRIKMLSFVVGFISDYKLNTAF